MTQSANPVDFIALVSDLTGVSQKVVGQAEARAAYMAGFTRLADAVAGQNATASLVSAYAALRQKMQPKDAAAALLAGALNGASPDPGWPYSAMARSLMTFLLLGLWKDPYNLSPDYDGVIPAAAAYAEGLVWLIAQAHPVGASTLAYGHWASPPPSLQDMIG